MNADRNLLLGLLALQLNFIDRQQLVSAFDRWSSDKAQSLGKILQRQGVITAERLLLLEALGAEHLKLHDNDPEKSLAALTPVGSARTGLERLADVDVQASLAHVSVARAVHDVTSTISYTAGTPTSAGTRFRILRPHAHGGLGEVYVAVDEELHREVALKEIQKRHADEPESRARFLLEAEITGGLEHPGIVPVYGLGTYADGRPFYAMRFIRGDSLKEAIERFHRADVPDRDPGERALELRKLLGRFIDVCNAIEYAHSRGVLHRDLKPGNIMLGSYGETLVVDWGLAKVVGRRDPQPASEEQTLRPSAGSASVPTEMGRAVGTPQFMSPEQARGRLDQLGPASDVYSLGATLYTLITGQPPFAKEDTRDVVERVARGDFPRPREANPNVPQGLDAVCLKTMALAPADRYKSPQALASDIEHWLADEPLSALQDTIVERAARWSRRHRPLTRSAAAALLIISAVSVTAAFVVDQARRDEKGARQLADRAAKRADDEKENALAAERNAEQAAEGEKEQRVEAERQTRIANSLRLANQSQSVRSDKPVRSILLALEAAQSIDRGDDVAWAASRQALRDGLGAIGGRPLVGYSPSSSASGGYGPFVAFSPDGRWVAAPSDDSTARLWDLKSTESDDGPTVLRGHQSDVLSLKFSPDGHWLATTSRDGTVRLWDLRAMVLGAACVVLPLPAGQVHGWLEFSFNGQWLAAVAADATVRLWNLTAKDPAASMTLINHDERNWTFAQSAQGPFHGFSGDSRWLVTTSADGTTTLWDLRANDASPTAQVLRGQNRSAAAPKFSADSHWLATAADDGACSLWDLTATDLVASAIALPSQQRPVGNLEISPDGRWLAAGSDDGMTRLWRLSAKAPPTTHLTLDRGPAFVDPNDDRWFLAFSPDSRWLASSPRMTNLRAGDRARLWDLSAKKPGDSPIVIESPEGDFWSLTFSPNGNWLAEASNNGASRLWDLRATGRAARPALLRGHQDIIDSAAFSPNSRQLATVSWDGTARLWDLTAGDPSAASIVLRGHEDAVASATFSRDGHWLVTESLDDTSARLWDLNRSEDVAGAMVLRGQSSPVFSPDGRWLATQTDEGAVRVRDVSASSPDLNAVVLPQQRLPVFGADARWLATASNDGTVSIWDLMTVTPAARTLALDDGMTTVTAMAFSPGGRWLAAAGENGMVRLWDAHANDPAASSQTLKTDTSYVYSLAFSGDRRWLAAATGDDNTSRLWDLKAATPRSLSLEGRPCYLTFTGDGHWLATAGEDGINGRLWNLERQDPTAGSLPLDGQLKYITFSHDGHWLVGAAAAGTMLLRDMLTDSSHDRFMVLEGHVSAVYDVAFSRDGRWLATTSYDGTARLWDLSASEPSTSSVVLRGHKAAVRNVALSPDGRWLATDALDETVRLWPLTDEDLVRRALASAGRELTIAERWQYLVPNAAAYTQRGISFGAREQWRQAKEDFRRSTEMDTDRSYWPVYLEGVVYLATGDLNAYRQAWHELYGRFKDASESERLGRIVYGFIPGNPEPERSNEIVELAKRYAKGNPAWQRVVAAALFRDGQYVASVEAFTEAANHFPPRAWDLLLMAMAQHKNGQPTDAQKTYQAALDWLKEATEKQWMAEWWERVEVEVLRAEAERLFQEAGKKD